MKFCNVALVMFYYKIIIVGWNVPFWFVKRCVLPFRKGRFTPRNGPFGKAELVLLLCRWFTDAYVGGLFRDAVLKNSYTRIITAMMNISPYNN